MFINRTEIIAKINHFSVNSEPFLFAVDFSGDKGFVLSPEEAEKTGILFDFKTGIKRKKSKEKKPFRFDLFPIPYEAYQAAFEKIIYHLNRGDTYLLNLTFPTPLNTDLTLAELYAISNAPYKLFIPGKFVVFSPEPFVMINGREIYSYPMKGTIDAAVPGAEMKLMASRKEFYEHNTIVDLLRNDLSMVSTNVKVTRFRYIDRIHTNRGDLLQVSSEVCGQLPGNFRDKLGEILFTLLPAGSVTGAPKKRTVEIIRDAENYDRGFYTGIFGYFDGESLSSAVSIRFIEQTPEGLMFKSGGGITALSDPKDEYREMIAKVYVPVV
jgi:para-aminobenzoate synthetase component 1